MSNEGAWTAKDWDTSQAMKQLDVKDGKKVLKPLSSNAIAKTLKLEVFQITARLASMEKRGYARRTSGGAWTLTRQGWELANIERPAETMRIKLPTGELGISDDGVPTFYSEKRWKVQYLWSGDQRYDIYIAPNGDRYIQCLPNEPADMIWQSTISKDWTIRMRRVEHSIVAHRLVKLIDRVIAREEA